MKTAQIKKGKDSKTSPRNTKNQKLIFLSWSKGDKALAEKIKDFLEDTLKVGCFMSDLDIIRQGTEWERTIRNNLKKANYGIILLSSNATKSPWVLYEAGALDAKTNFKGLTVLSNGVRPTQVPKPLRSKQMAKLNKMDDLLGLTTNILRVLKINRQKSRIETKVKEFVKSLKKKPMKRKLGCTKTKKVN